jgi:hypothetical protein
VILLKNVRSPERELIRQRLLKAPLDETISWDSLELLTGCPRDIVRNLVGGERKKLERELSIFFHTETGEGVRRISHNEVAHTVLPSGVRRLGGRARRLHRQTQRVDFLSLSPSERATTAAIAAVSELTAKACAPRHVKKLESVTEVFFSPADALKALLSG